MNRIIVTLLITVFPLISFGHSGRTNAEGCHHNRKTGNYHCHNPKKSTNIHNFSGKVISVLDGDTIEVLYQGRPHRIRLAEIDCPEKNQAFGKKAKQFTSDMVFGKTVTVRSLTKDKYGRLVGNVILPDGTNLNHELVRAGFAWQYKKYSSSIQIKNLEAEARSAKRGLWTEGNPTPPWEFRKRGIAKE